MLNCLAQDGHSFEIAVITSIYARSTKKSLKADLAKLLANVASSLASSFVLLVVTEQFSERTEKIRSLAKKSSAIDV